MWDKQGANEQTHNNYYGKNADVCDLCLEQTHPGVENFVNLYTQQRVLYMMRVISTNIYSSQCRPIMPRKYKAASKLASAYKQ